MSAVRKTVDRSHIWVLYDPLLSDFRLQPCLSWRDSIQYELRRVVSCTRLAFDRLVRRSRAPVDVLTQTEPPKIRLLRMLLSENFRHVRELAARAPHERRVDVRVAGVAWGRPVGRVLDTPRNRTDFERAVHIFRNAL